MKHEDHIEKYNGDLGELAYDVGMMRYGKTAEFLSLLAADMDRQAEGDRNKNRPKLAARLEAVAAKLREAQEEMSAAWEICEPFMKQR